MRYGTKSPPGTASAKQQAIIDYPFSKSERRARLFIGFLALALAAVMLLAGTGCAQLAGAIDASAATVAAQADRHCATNTPEQRRFYRTKVNAASNTGAKVCVQCPNDTDAVGCTVTERGE